MSSNQRPQEMVVDQTVNLSCGCIVVYMKGDLDAGRLFLCKKHINEDVFTGLRLVNTLASQIRAGATSFVLEGR